MNAKDLIRMDGSLLAIGDSRRILCPFCHGGQSYERSMNISRNNDGVVYNCHRVSCSKTGFVGLGSGTVTTLRLPKDRPADLYTGEMLRLRPEDEKYFLEQYEIRVDNSTMRRTEHDEYLVPIICPQGWISGYNVRQPWPDAPCKGRTGQPKSRVYLEDARPAQSFYLGRARTGGTVVLVEDQLSAIKASQHANISWAVAIMGAHLDVARVQEIAQLRPSEVLIALDSDATETSFKLARQYGLAFRKTRVVILDKDIKDTPAKDINEVLGL